MGQLSCGRGHSRRVIANRQHHYSHGQRIRQDKNAAAGATTNIHSDWFAKGSRKNRKTGRSESFSCSACSAPRNAAQLGGSISYSTISRMSLAANELSGPPLSAKFEARFPGDRKNSGPALAHPSIDLSFHVRNLSIDALKDFDLLHESIFRFS